MAFEMDDRGRFNLVEIDESCNVNDLKIEIRGNKNKILVAKNSKFLDQYIRIWGHCNTIEIGEDCKIIGRILFDGDEQRLSIGDGTTFERVGIVVAEGASVRIGEDCMFSYGISVRTSDAHSIIDTTTGKRTNFARDVVIGQHVWVGAETIIQKDALLSDNSIVGIRSIVNDRFEEKNIAVGGIPARHLRSNVDWRRELLAE